jgi:hypothetical protein
MSSGTYTSHQLENRVLCLVKEDRHLLQALDHRFVIAYCARHPTGQIVAEIVVNV